MHFTRRRLQPRSRGGAPLHQQLRDSLPAAIGGALEGRISFAIARVNGRAAIEQRPRYFHIATPGRHVQGSRPGDAAAGVNIRSGSHQRADHIGARFGRAFVRHTVERRMSAAVLHIWVRAQTQQQPNHLEGPGAGCEMQKCPSEGTMLRERGIARHGIDREANETGRGRIVPSAPAVPRTPTDGVRIAAPGRGLPDRPRRQWRRQCHPEYAVPAIARLILHAPARQSPFPRHKRNSAGRIDETLLASPPRGGPLRAPLRCALTTRSARQGRCGNAREIRAGSATTGPESALRRLPGIG